MSINTNMIMENFQLIVYDLFELHFSDDLFELLVQFIPSEYVNLLFNLYNDGGINEIFIPKKYIECNWDVMFRDCYMSHRAAEDLIFTIPDYIKIYFGGYQNSYVLQYVTCSSEIYHAFYICSNMLFDGVVTIDLYAEMSPYLKLIIK